MPPKVMPKTGQEAHTKEKKAPTEGNEVPPGEERRKNQGTEGDPDGGGTAQGTGTFQYQGTNASGHGVPSQMDEEDLKRVRHLTRLLPTHDEWLKKYESRMEVLRAGGIVEKDLIEEMLLQRSQMEVKLIEIVDIHDKYGMDASKFMDEFDDIDNRVNRFILEFSMLMKQRTDEKNEAFASPGARVNSSKEEPSAPTTGGFGMGEERAKMQAPQKWKA
jgi:hypothetical protein